MSQTDLVISRIGFPPFSARGVTQTLEPLLCGEARRTIDGRLVYTGLPSHEKYKSLVLCEDKAVLAMGSLWRGAEVEVSCVAFLTQECRGRKGDTLALARPAVVGSVRLYDEARQRYEARLEESGTTVTLTGEGTYPNTFYLSYRPLLKMRILTFKFLADEWGGKEGWRMTLEEI